jgi:hypothetical protein
MTEHAFPLDKIPPVDGLHVKGPPTLNRGMIFGGSRTPGNDDGEGPFAFQFRLLNLLTGRKTTEEKETKT